MRLDVKCHLVEFDFDSLDSTHLAKPLTSGIQALPGDNVWYLICPSVMYKEKWHVEDYCHCRGTEKGMEDSERRDRGPSVGS